MRKVSITTVLIMTAALAGSAWAQAEGEEGTEGTAEGEGSAEGEVATPPPDGEAMPPPATDDAAPTGKPPMVLPKGKLAVFAALGIDLSTDAVAKPIALAPDVWYGVMPKLEVGVVHSNSGLIGWWSQGLGGGLCVTGEDNGCAKFYNGPVGLLAHYLVMEGNMDMSAEGGVIMRSLDPSMLGLKLGVRGRWMSGKIGVFFTPNVYIGMTKRDVGNKERIALPFIIGYMISDKLKAGVNTGIDGPTSGFGDSYVIPLGIGAMFKLNDNMSVNGSFNFPAIAGGSPLAGTDLRDLTLGFMWHN